MTVHVHLDASDPATHLVHVTQTFPAASDDATALVERTFRMAAWVPGSYKIRDFGRHVQDVTAEADGKKTAVEQVGKDAWRVKARGAVTLRFAVYCRELTVDTSHVTADHAHIFPATVVLYDDHSRSQPHEVSLAVPDEWGVWTGLQDLATGDLTVADDYDHLIDCPIEAAPKDDVHEETFTVRRKKHRFVVWRPPADVDWQRITKDVRAVVEATAKIFGGLPYQHYTFISHVALNHGGGLEHRNSTILGLDPQSLVVDEKIKTSLLPLVAHEFFHTWNVKRIKPAAFAPYDLQTEVYTDLLWLFEGFTTYYELPILYRAGVVDEEAFGKITAEMLQYYEMALGRKRRSVAEASRLTWSLLYQAHEHNINRNVSYYTKGLFVGLCLDAHLRVQGVKDGLDEVMRYLWQEYADTGVPEDAFADIVKAATGIDCTRLLAGWTKGTTELPIDKSLRNLGWAVEREHKDKDHPNGLGIHFKPKGRVIDRIPEDAPAWRVLQPADEVIAAHGYKWDGQRFAAMAATMEPGDEVEIAVFREGRLRTFNVPIMELPKTKVSVKVRKGDAVATRRRKAWLESA